MAAARELYVLEVGDVANQGVADSGAGMGIVVAVEHEGRGDYGGKRGGLDSAFLQAEDVGPGLVEAAFVGREGGGSVGKRIEGIAAIENLAELGEESIATCLVGHGCELLADFVDPGAVVRCEPPFDGFPIGGTGVRVVGATADESERPDAARMAGGVGEGEHGAPRMPDDCGVVRGDGGEVVDVPLDGEWGDAGAALQGLEDVEVGREFAGEIGDGAGSAGPSVQQDDGGIATPCSHLCSRIAYGASGAVKTDFDRFAIHGKLSRRGAARGVSTDAPGAWTCGEIGWGRRI